MHDGCALTLQRLVAQINEAGNAPARLYIRLHKKYRILAQPPLPDLKRFIRPFTTTKLLTFQEYMKGLISRRKVTSDRSEKNGKWCNSEDRSIPS